jgi:16S rRNA (cytosine1402-N4)-methyltransferase
LVPTDATIPVLPTAPPTGHAPVMLAEVLRALGDLVGRTVLDATFGGGGYSRAILAAGADRVIALDRDPDAVARGRAMAADDPRLTIVHARFGELDQVAAAEGAPAVDAVVFDLGVSSFQLDQPERGFSFRYDAPLDMRMDRDGPTAAELLADIGEVELARLLWNYGDERDARRVARAVVAERQKSPVVSTRQLAEIVARAKGPSRELIDPATRTFQALRIAVNDELGELRQGLDAAEHALHPGGRLVTVAFHSGEDSIVKDFVNERGGRIRRANRHLPALADEEPRWGWLVDRPWRPGPEETGRNPRARSARLRSAMRLGAGITYRGPERVPADMSEGER